MKTNPAFRLLSPFGLVVLLTTAGFSQSPKKVYSEVYYHKIKPGHTFAEARAVENEFKKLHQVQANDGHILGWYMLVTEMTTNPNKEYDYITIKNFDNPGYMDNAYPQKYFTQVMGTDYQAKLNDLYKRMQDVKEVTRSEIWEQISGAAPATIPSADKAPVWLINGIKVKIGQESEYVSRVKKLQPMYQELVNQGKEVFWNFAALAYPSSAESPSTFASVVQLANMKALLEEPNLEEAFKKTMPGVDRKQFYKELDDIRHFSRQEVYYLLEYAVKTPSAQAAK